MKITIFVTYTFPYIGSGIGNVALKQAEVLASYGHDVTVISSNFPKSDVQFTRNGVNHIKLNAVYFLERLHVPVPLYFFNGKVIRAIKTSDIVHVHDAIYPSSFLAAIIAKIFHKKLILTQHIGYVAYPNQILNIIQKLAYLTLGKMTFYLSDKIIYLNPNTKKLFHEFNKDCLIQNGVDLALFHPNSGNVLLREKYKLPIYKKIVLFVGRFVPKKGFKLLFEARDHNYLLLFVGGGEIPAYMKNTEDVFFIPPQTQEHLKEIYQLSDIFILPSHGEGFPLSIQEAMACGLPIITSKENIFDKSIDFISTIDLSIVEIKKAILSLIHNPSATKEMALKSRNYAEANYSWETNIKRLIEIYK